MSDLKVLKFENSGPAGTGLTAWDEIPQSALTAGKPVQTGHNYFTDDTGTLTSGVWHCTPMTTKSGPYDVNEFMLVLDGSVTIVHDSGDEQTIKAGESFIIPKGTPCSWKQTEDIRKFYVIFDDPSGEGLGDDGLNVRRPNLSDALAPVGEQDTSRYIGDVPDQTIKVYFQDATKQMTVGVWTTTEMHTKPAPFGRNELMHLLEGEVTLTDDKGGKTTYKAGDTFIVPKGITYQWDSTGFVKKIFCIYQPKEAVALAADAAE